MREEDVTTTNRLRSVPKRNIARIDRAEQREKMPVTIVLQNSSENSQGNLGLDFHVQGTLSEFGMRGTCESRKSL